MTRLSLLALPVFLLALAASADEPAPVVKSNTLTPKEIADGWISLFDGETTFGWKIEGEGKVEDGVLALGGGSSAATTSAFGPGQFLLIADVSGDGATAVWGDVKEKTPTAGALKLESDKVKPTVPHPLRLAVPEGQTLKVKSIRYLPIGHKSLFTGKDLAGWNAVAGKPSKFDVNADGELTITDGPGDLHTEGQWDDFLLQLDVKSNGKHLNSGVFFRSVPNEFWSGYEAQIRNEWKGDDRAKPVDFGTGGLYNRQRARKVVSTDGEWFTMTVLAHGPHIAIWVNGHQTVDFTETKPLGDNARKGGKVTAGTISLQGHDPTTNLSFRNIRLAPLPKPEAK